MTSENPSLEKFKSFMQFNNYGKRVPKFNTFIDGMTRHLGQAIRGEYWTGITYK